MTPKSYGWLTSLKAVLFHYTLGAIGKKKKYKLYHDNYEQGRKASSLNGPNYSEGQIKWVRIISGITTQVTTTAGHKYHGPWKSPLYEVVSRLDDAAHLQNGSDGHDNDLCSNISPETDKGNLYHIWRIYIWLSYFLTQVIHLLTPISVISGATNHLQKQKIQLSTNNSDDLIWFWCAYLIRNPWANYRIERKYRLISVACYWCRNITVFFPYHFYIRV